MNERYSNFPFEARLKLDSKLFILRSNTRSRFTIGVKKKNARVNLKIIFLPLRRDFFSPRTSTFQPTIAFLFSSVLSQKIEQFGFDQQVPTAKCVQENGVFLSC